METTFRVNTNKKEEEDLRLIDVPGLGRDQTLRGGVALDTRDLFTVLGESVLGRLADP